MRATCEGERTFPDRTNDARVKAEPVRILVPLEHGESAREPARLLSGLFAPAAIRARALHVVGVAVPHFYFPSGSEALGSLRREHLAWEEKARKALKSQVGPLEDAGFAVDIEVASGSVLGEVLKRAQLGRADLALARPRRGRARSVGLGSVAAGLMQTASARFRAGGLAKDPAVGPAVLRPSYSPASTRRRARADSFDNT